MGLDLSDSGPELRPSLAVLAIGVPDQTVAADKAHADKLTAALVGASRKTGWFAKVLDNAQSEAVLADKAAAARTCGAAECFADLARMLGVDRVLAAQMAFPSDGPTLHIAGFDVGTSNVEEVTIAAQGKPAGFDRSVATGFKPLLQKLSTLLGTVKITPSVAAATVEVAGRFLGQGTVEKPVPAGTLKVKITAPDFQTFEGEVTVEPKGKAELAATLTAKPMNLPPPVLKPDEPAFATKPVSTGKSVFERPGLYMAILGAAAAGTGGYLAWSAKQTENKAKTPDSYGVVPVTLKQKSDAILYARIANALFAAGGALFAGGVLWAALEPSGGSSGGKPGHEKEPGHEPGVGEPVAFLVGIHKEF
jgi:hypothetical protein